MTPIEVYYDSWCPICTAARRRVERLDWLGLIRFQSTRDPAATAALGVTAEQLEERMHARHLHNGKVVDGIWALVAVFARVPLLMPLWPLVTGVAYLGFGQALYDWVARRRTVIPVGACNDVSCNIHRRDS